MTRPHHCHATGCGSSVKPEMLMCPRHWRMVPLPVQRAVWRTYRKGQCDDMRPSPAYCHTAREAVVLVAKKEGLTPDTALYDRFLAVDPAK